jgi:argininosuccinate lyase
MSPTKNTPVWQKNSGPSPRIIRYCAGRDVAARPAADEVLTPHDLWTNHAHCRMLEKTKIINSTTSRDIRRGLKKIEKAWQEGRFRLNPALEDVHINIENTVAKHSGGAAAGAMHTARSRNDQTTTDVRMWLREQVLDRIQAVSSLVRTLAAAARKQAHVIAPGWTHGQPAMPTTLGHWLASHGWALLRDAQALESLWPALNLCPLGAVASFGTSWPIDRKLTAKLLAFDGLQVNSLDCISSRWEIETRVASSFTVLMNHLSSLGQDLIFLSTPPREGIVLDDAHVTGSSIMPNKRNPDFAEVTRARAVSVHGLLSSLSSVGCGALSGYNRDTQWTKYWIMDILEEVGEAPEVFMEVIKGMAINRIRLKSLAVEGFSLSADLADHLARTRKVPFRKAYHVVGKAVSMDHGESWFRLESLNRILKREKIRPLMNQAELTAAGDPGRALSQRTSEGSPAPDDVRSQATELNTCASRLERSARSRLSRIASARLQCTR